MQKGMLIGKCLVAHFKAFKIFENEILILIGYVKEEILLQQNSSYISPICVHCYLIFNCGI